MVRIKTFSGTWSAYFIEEKVNPWIEECEKIFKDFKIVHPILPHQFMFSDKLKARKFEIIIVYEYSELIEKG